MEIISWTTPEGSPTSSSNPPSINPVVSNLSTLFIPERSPDLPIAYSVELSDGDLTIEHESIPVPITTPGDAVDPDVITLEIPLNSRGNLIGAIKTVYPKSLDGNFSIAERSAINAVMESIPFQVPKEIFPNGLILRVDFDPKTNIGANNG